MDKCSQPLETFADTKAWLSHMEMEHKKTIVRWTCNAKHESPAVFSSEQDFISHMRDAHPKVATKSQLPVITKRSGKPAAQMFVNCPLCGWLPEPAADRAGSAEEQGEEYVQDEAKTMRTKSKLTRHIAEHLQDIALRSLPEDAFPPEHGSIGSVTSSNSSTNSSTESNMSDLDITTSEVELLSRETLGMTGNDLGGAGNSELSTYPSQPKVGDDRHVFDVESGEAQLSPVLHTAEQTSRNDYWGWLFTALTKIQISRPELPNPCMSWILIL